MCMSSHLCRPPFTPAHDVHHQGNDIAIALYEGMGFELVAVESDLMAKSRRRAPRIYLSKRLA